MGQPPTGRENPMSPTGIRPCLLPTSAPHGRSGPAIPYRHTGYRASGGGRPGNEVAFRTPSAPSAPRCTNDIVNKGLVHDLEPIASRSHPALSKVLTSYGGMRMVWAQDFVPIWSKKSARIVSGNGCRARTVRDWRRRSRFRHK